MRAKDSESEFSVRDARRCAAQECARRRLIDGLAVRSWIMPRRQKLARAKRKVEGRKKIANGTAGQTQAFSLANPVGSMGFRELLVRTSAHGPYESTGVESRSRRRGWYSPRNGSNAPLRVPRNRSRCTRKTIRDANDALCGRLRVC